MLMDGRVVRVFPLAEDKLVPADFRHVCLARASAEAETREGPDGFVYRWTLARLAVGFGPISLPGPLFLRRPTPLRWFPRFRVGTRNSATRLNYPKNSFFCQSPRLSAHRANHCLRKGYR